MLTTFMVTTLDDGPVGSVAGSLRQAIHDANSALGPDTIEFDPALVGTIAFTDGQVAITDDLIVDGPGDDLLTIDAQNTSRIFWIDRVTAPPLDVTLRGLTLTGGNASYGGAIFSKENLTIDASSITGNSASLDGGGILADESIVLTISDSTISNNYAVDDGGGIFARLNTSVLISSSTISGNSTGDDGAGISVKYYLYTNDTLIHGNSADDGGGVRGESDSYITIVNSTISENSAIDDGGGILVSFDSVLTITDSTLEGNSTMEVGGAIYAAFFSDVTITNSTMSQNSAKDAGAIRGASDTVLRITDSTITENFASDDCGGIYAKTDLFLTNSTVTDNYADDGAGVMGGTLSNLNITDSTISNNFAVDDGGGLLAIWGSETTITGSTISGNSAADDGGGIAAAPNADMWVINSTVSGNSAASGGGIAAQYTSAVTVTNSTIYQNSSNDSGGGVYVEPTAIVGVENSILAGNSAGVLGSNISGSVSANFNLIEDTSGATISGADNITGLAALLGPLTDHGGATYTHALLVGSPAIDAADPNASAGVGDVPLYDQRGMPFGRVEDGDNVPGARLDMGAFEVQPTVVDGDFNDDGFYDCLDIDALTTEIAAMSHDPNFDLTADGLVDLDDLDAWLIEGGANNPAQTSGNAFLKGDANLDGIVDGLDFIKWNENRFTTNSQWCSGDFNADGTVDGLDFIIWNEHRFQSSGLLERRLLPDRQSDIADGINSPTGLLPAPSQTRAYVSAADRALATVRIDAVFANARRTSAQHAEDMSQRWGDTVFVEPANWL